MDGFSQLRVSDSSDHCDRLSELTESLIFVILSFLPITDVVRTTLLSKRWKDLWTTFPYLDFSNNGSYFIRKALAQWKGDKILNFKLDFPRDLPADIDLWLHFVIEKQVEELSIDLGQLRRLMPRLCEEYSTPQCLYSCSSITKLSLISCKLKIVENVQMNRLKSLTIEGRGSLISDEALDQLLSGSPLLEELNLCFWSYKLNIRSRSLKMLKIGRHVEFWGFCKILKDVMRIWAPNLLTLQISAFVNVTCLFDVPSLTNAILDLRPCDDEINFEEFEMFDEVLRSIRHVEKVILSNSCVEFLFFGMMKKDMVVLLPFSNAKFLKLYSNEADKILDVLEMFPNLMTMIISDSDQWDEDTRLYDLIREYKFVQQKLQGDSVALNKEIHVAMLDACQSLAFKANHPSLEFFQLNTLEITWSIHNPSIISLVEFLLENAHMLGKMVLRLRMDGANLETFIIAKEKVMSMRRSSPTAQLAIIKDK